MMQLRFSSLFRSNSRQSKSAAAGSTGAFGSTDGFFHSMGGIGSCRFCLFGNVTLMPRKKCESLFLVCCVVLAGFSEASLSPSSSIASASVGLVSLVPSSLSSSSSERASISSSSSNRPSILTLYDPPSPVLKSKAFSSRPCCCQG